MASQGTTSSRVTRNFAHLIQGKGLSAIVRSQARTRFPWGRPSKDAHHLDRIKRWNIVPGDKVRLVRGPRSDPDRIVSVLSVNKATNQVLLEELTENRNGVDIAAKAHYSNIQLLVGTHEFAPKEGSETPEIKNVFATRLSTSKPYYLKQFGHWIWQRYAAKTTPELPLPEGASSRKTRPMIPWPKSTPFKPPNPSAYDTLPEDVLAVTYNPIHPSINPLTKEPTSTASTVDFEDAYIRSLLHPEKYPYDPSLPVERYAFRELSNPHSRAKKQARWQAKAVFAEELKIGMIRKELGDLKGRKRAEARREAIFMWKAKMEKDEKEAKRSRWEKRGGVETLQRHKERKDRKERRKQVRLREIILTTAKNQYIPGTSKPVRA